MRKGFLIYEEMRKYFPIYEAVSNIWLCNCSTLNFLIYEENLIFFFISVQFSLSRKLSMKYKLWKSMWENVHYTLYYDTTKNHCLKGSNVCPQKPNDCPISFHFIIRTFQFFRREANNRSNWGIYTAVRSRRVFADFFVLRFVDFQPHQAIIK